MLEFIVKYWIEFLFGLIVTGGGIFLKRYAELVKKEQKAQQNEFYSKLKAEISDSYQQSQYDDKVLQGEIDDLKDELNCLKKGILSLQGRQFKQACIMLLNENHDISLEEYQEIDNDHDAYNGLGGNHNGDRLFNLVKKKAERTLTVTTDEADE
jgi:hypothetical protein